MYSRILLTVATTLCLLFSCVVANSVDLSKGHLNFFIGSRIVDDQLLVHDVLIAKPLSDFETPAVVFNYAVPEPITYIEIATDSNVKAKVTLSYYNDLVSGIVKAVETHATPFEVDVFIYGINDTSVLVNPEYLLNRNIEYKDVMMDVSAYDVAENSNTDEQYETIRKFDDLSLNNQTVDAVDSTDENNDEEEVEELEDDESVMNLNIDLEDKVIHLGARQANDELLYETFQTSAASSVEPTTHTTVFYYIDNNFITYVQFIIYGHFSGKNIEAPEYKPPVAEYSHFTPHSFRASITDFNTTSLFVNMYVFGYRPANVSMHYVPFLSKSKSNSMRGGMATQSPLERLKLLMKSESNSLRAATTTTDVEQDSDTNNRISITDDNNALKCAQSHAASSMQTNAVYYLLLLLLGIEIAINMA